METQNRNGVFAELSSVTSRAGTCSQRGPSKRLPSWASSGRASTAMHRAFPERSHQAAPRCRHVARRHERVQRSLARPQGHAARFKLHVCARGRQRERAYVHDNIATSRRALLGFGCLLLSIPTANYLPQLKRYSATHAELGCLVVAPQYRRDGRGNARAERGNGRSIRS